MYSALGLPRWLSDKESTCSAGDAGLIPGREDPLEKGMVIHSSILAWQSHESRSLVGYSSRGHKRIEHDLVTNQQQQNSAF